MKKGIIRTRNVNNVDIEIKSDPVNKQNYQLRLWSFAPSTLQNLQMLSKHLGYLEVGPLNSPSSRKKGHFKTQADVGFITLIG